MRESRPVKVARLAYQAAQETLPRDKHPQSTHYTLPQLAACVLLKFSLNISYRGMERWLYENEPVCRVLELSRVPHHTTLRRTVKILHKADLEKIKRRLWTGAWRIFPKNARRDRTPSQAPKPCIAQSGGCTNQEASMLNHIREVLPS